MRLTKIRIKNFRSIQDTGDISVSSLQALVGENNSGKSNVLRALKCFLTSGAGGMGVTDFNDRSQPAVIECTFSGLSKDERRRLRRYLLGEGVVLRKDLFVITDEAKAKETVKSEYHGYQAEPKEIHLSIPKIEEKFGSRPKWTEIAEHAGILPYVQDENGKVTKPSYRAGLERYLTENDVEYDEPVIGETQALGIAPNLLSALPEIHLLPAITDYSDEIDRRSTSTVFRKLMGDLADRVMRADPRYGELKSAINQVHALLNSTTTEGAPARLTALSEVENALQTVVAKLMPTAESISLGVEVEPTREIFSKGVSIKINDGVLTDVLDKGHGMQRSLVFALLQMLIESTRGEAPAGARPIILAIEEPELYIHPHCQRLIFQALKDFSGIQDDGTQLGTDQVIYTTHSPAFIEVWNYERIGVVRKPSLKIGTIVKQANAAALDGPDERKTFKMLTSFGLKHNEVFFARTAIIVEGPEDEIGIIATARKLKRIRELPDEVGLSVIVANGKGEIPKFQKVLNAFDFDYGVLLELDGKPETDPQTANILKQLGANRVGRVPRRVEDFLNVGRHFDDQRHAKEFFSDPDRINAEFEKLVLDLLP